MIGSNVKMSPTDMIGWSLKQIDVENLHRQATKMISDGHGDDLMPGIIWDEYTLSANTFENLFDRNGKVAIFNLYDPKDNLASLSKIKAPVYTVMGRKDGALTVPVEELMDRIRNALIGSSHVEMEILGDANHGYEGDEQKLADKILTWITR
jgi:pimeloyl-ACP methyl ester carboxylesterase